MKASRVIHCCIDLDALIHRGLAGKLAGGLASNGKPMTEAEIVAHAAVLKARGFDAMPTCENFDARGHCKGCPA